MYKERECILIAKGGSPIGEAMVPPNVSPAQDRVLHIFTSSIMMASK